MLENESALKLFPLHIFESRRSNGFVEKIYHSTALEILNEERCFRIEITRGRLLSFQLMDSSQQPKFIELSFNKDKWSQYVDSYSGQQEPTSGTLDLKKHHVFLVRNFRRGARASMDNVELDNRLECKICCSTFRLFYVEETEDYFYRRGHISKAAKAVVSEKRMQRFNQWVGQPR